MGRSSFVRAAAVLTTAFWLSAPAEAAPPAADDRSVPFGGPAWLAIRGRTPQQLARALKLTNLRRATWKDGLAAAKAEGSRTVFLTPDVHGWTLVVGAAFLAHVESTPPDFPDHVQALSVKLDTEVQLFAEAGETCAWARAEGGTRLRAFSCFTNRLRAVDLGAPDKVDRLNVQCARGELVCGVDVREIAARWSIDPSGGSTLRAERRIPAAVPRGFLAELPQATPRKLARPRFAPPDWVRDAAEKLEAPAAALDAACTRGEPAACAGRASLLLAGGQAARSLPRAAALAAKACEGGRAAGCALQGWMMRRGFGLEEDRSAAQRLLERACDGGHAPGCFLLGASLQRGEGTASQSGAWDAYERACAGGYGPACARTGGTPGAGLAPRPACKREREASEALGTLSFPALIERVRRHQRLARGEVQDLPRWQVRLLRNAVFAARGRTFEARDLRAFFAGYDWYAPAGKDVDGLLSPDDRRNVALLQDAEACAEATIADDAGEGDWQLVELWFLTEADPPLSELASSVVGTWEPCGGQPAEGLPAHVFDANGRVVHGWAGAPDGQIGRWRVDGSKLRVRWFATMKLVGAGFSPAEPGDENDEEPSAGVPKLFPSEQLREWEDWGDELFRQQADDDHSTFQGGRLCHKGG